MAGGTKQLGAWQVVQNSLVSVPTSQCSSGQAYTERRTRAGIGSGCTEPTSETQRVCKFQ